MRGRRPGVSLLLVAVLGGCSVAAPADTAPPAGTAVTPRATTATTATTEPLPSVQLPPLAAPLALPSGDPKVVAAALATALRDPVQLSQALSRAFLASGLPVLGDDGLPVEGSPNGLAVEAWEVSLVASLEPTRSGGLLLSDLGIALQAADPDLTESPLADLMLEDLRTAATDPDAATQTWALTIAELGRQGDGVDPLAAQDPDLVALDGLQIQLLLRRLASEIALDALAPAASLDAPLAPAVVLAAARAPNMLPAAAVNAPAPCTYSKVEDRIVTGGEEVLSRGFKKVLGHLKEKGVSGAGGLGRVLGIAGVTSDLSKFLMTYLLLKGDFKLEGDRPLVRTKKQRPVTGEQRQLVAKVYYDIGNAQAINCFRLVFANLGLKFQVPKDGPVPDAPVTWTPIKGFDARSDRIVQLYGGNPTGGATDTQGIARMGVEGFGQEQEIPASAMPVKKQATVWLLVQIKRTSLGGDIWDAIKVWEGGAAAGPLKLVLESLYRSKLLAPLAFTFAVTDWDLPDYRIDKTVSATIGATSYSIRYTGTKCDGLAGEWVIDSGGQLTDVYGGLAEIGGTIFVQIAEGTLTGTMGGTARAKAVAGGGVHVPGQEVTEGVFGGTGKFIPEPPTLELTVTSGSGNGYNWGFLDTGVFGPGTLTFPLEVGDFCK